MVTKHELRAPYQYFGGKRDVADIVWQAFGSPKQYIEPFCGSAAVLLAAPSPASLEVVGDANGFIANFWRATANQYEAVAHAADYPVSHVDLGGRHKWLMDQRERLGAELQDPNWPGDPKVAGWWLWGQCCWIGSGWCDWERKTPIKDTIGQVPHVGDAGRGIQALGQVPHVTSAGQGIQALGQVPHVSDAGRGEFLTSSGRVAFSWLGKLADRLERVRIVHGDWSRCLNHHYGGSGTAVFLDPPYLGYEKLYGESTPVARQVEQWARDNQEIRIALCGHSGDYDLPGWTEYRWTRKRNTYSGSGTKDREVIMFSPACLQIGVQNSENLSLFG
jgi:hypothetical protein